MSEQKPRLHRLLVAVGDDYFRAILHRVLQKEGYDVEETGDGSLAQNLLGMEDYDLVICSQDLARVDGLALLGWAKKRDRPAAVILVTEPAGEWAGKKAADLGSDELLVKPFGDAYLFAVIERALAARQPPKVVDLDDQYCKINIDEFVSGRKLDVDLFIRINYEKYLKVAHAGQEISLDRVRSYKEKGVRFLHVTKGDFRRYVDFSATLTKAVAGSKIQHSRKVNYARYATKLLAQHFHNDLIERETYEDARQIMETTVSIISEDTDIYQLLEALKRDTDVQLVHGVGASFYSTLMARKMGWLSPVLLFRVSMGGLIHDIGVKEIEAEILEKKRIEMSAEEVSKIESHCIRGAEILMQVRQVPGEIIQIAAQHHENAIGTGYPRRLKHKKIHPLARLVAVADQFCELVLPSIEGPGLSPKEALARLTQYQAERLDIDALTALHAVFQEVPPNAAFEGARRVQKATI